MIAQAPDSGRQAFFRAALAQRDLVTAGLAKGDSSTVPAVQGLFQSALENVQTGLQ